MKGKFTNFYAILAALFLLYSFSSSAPVGRTGAPGDSNCTNCHVTGNNFNGNAQITGLPAMITPNQTYQITVTSSVTSGTPIRTGFSMVALDGSINNVGTLSNNSTNTNVISAGNGRTYFGHAPATVLNGNTSASWTVDWTAPAGPAGEVITMYTNTILGNGSGSSGDNMFHGEAMGTIAGGGGGNITAMITNTTDVSCLGGNDGSATVEAADGSGNYQYNWSNGGTTATINNLTTDNYSVTVTDMVGGATAEASTFVDQPDTGVSVNIITQQDIDCNNPVGSATANGIGGTGSISYNWSNGATGQTVNLNAGQYTVTATDANGCTNIASGTIASDTTPPNADAGVDMSLDCTTTTTTLDGTASSSGNVSYLWTTNDGSIVAGTNTTMPSVDAAGTYTLTVTDNGNGCTASDEVTVIENADIPVANAGTSMTLDCVNNSAMLDGTGSSTGANISYLWTTVNGNIVNGANTLNPTVDTAGEYCIEVSDNSNGCVSIACVTVTADFAIPTIVIASPNDIDCNNFCVMLDATGSSQGNNFIYQWTGPNILNGATTLIAEVCSVGTYELVVTNTTNGCTASAAVVVSESTTAPTISINISDELNCNNSSVTISAVSSATNSSYDWTGPNNFTSNIANPSVSVAGTYTLTVTDNDNGCSASIQGIVNETMPPVVTISNQINVDCNGQNTGSATAIATAGTGNYTYEWSSGGMMATEMGLPAGTYTVTATDGDQCTATAMVTITEPTAITVNASATGVTGAGTNDGTAAANPMGGTPDYAYLWSNMETTQMISNLTPDNYTVTVTDANGCTAVEMVVVSNFDCSGLSIDFTTNNVTCNNGNDGSVTAVLNGGMMPITYMWSNTGMGATISNLEAGTYSVTATDANNCQLTGSATVTEPMAITIMATGTNVTCNGGMDGTATAIATGGTGVLTYAWSNGMDGATITELSVGVYTVMVTDENNCTAMASVTITEPAAIVLAVTTTNETANGANDGTAFADVSGGAGGYTFIWSNNENTQEISNLSPGDYCVTVTDTDGCTAEACGFVMMFGCGNVSTVVTSTSVSCFGDSDGSASAESFGGTEPYTYAWSNGANTANINDLPAGTYTVTCTDATACSAVMDITIEQPTELIVSVFESGDVDCEGNENGFASASAMGGILAYSYLWSNGDTTSTISDLALGMYSLTVTDANNCTTEASTVIELLPDTEMPMVLTNDVIAFLDANGVASVTPEMVDAGSTDNCGIAELVLDLTEFDCDDLGANEVILAVLDNAGLCAAGTAMVMVSDTIVPVLTCPANITMQGCGVVVEYDVPIAADNCETGDPFIVNGLPSGANFPSGTTTVEWGVNDTFGNPGMCSFTVTLENDFSTSATFTIPTCAGFSDGTATAETTNGVTPFTYEWNDAAMQTTQTAINLSAGEYMVTVTDATGCSTVATITVDEPEVIDIQIVEVIAETNGDMDGAITIEVNGGTGNPFSYQWFMDGDLFSEDPNLTGLSAGEYVLFVTDPSNCMSSDTVVVDMNVGIFENNDEQNITLYPNPTTGEFQLDIELSIEKEVSVSVFDVTGRTVFVQNEQSILKDNLTIDLTDFSDGIYLVRVQVGEDVLVRRILLRE